MFLALPLIFITAQLMLGYKKLHFPKFITRRRIKKSHILSACNLMVPYVQKFEHIVTPRYKYLTTITGERIVAFVCFLLSWVIFLPIPFGNTIPAVAICLFAVGILQRDGIFIILGAAVSILGIAIIGVFFKSLYFVFMEFID